MPDETAVAVPKKRGRPKKETVVAIETIRQLCQYCAREILPGREPAIWSTCSKCAAVEAAFLAQPPCENCGGRPGRNAAGVILKDGHRDSCITRAQPAQPRRKLTDEDIADIRRQLGPAPVAL
jgi:hypothetical protein